MKTSRSSRVVVAVAIVIAVFAAPALALDNQQASAGIKEALANATTGAVNVVGRPGGYFDDPAIKILLPSQLQPVAKGLRAIGAGAQVDKFEKSMNDAAEAAAPQAEPIFERAISNMSISDAQRIVTGGKTSATDYFRRKTSGELTAAFTPIVKQEMAKYSVTQQYESMVGKYQSGSALGGLLGGGALGGLSGKFDLDSYVVRKSLDGLFYMAGQEEAKIRTNPAAQVTPLLREVFGGR